MILHDTLQGRHARHIYITMQTQNHSTITHTVKKLPLFELVSLMAMLTALVALSLDAMLPILTDIGSDLSSSSAQQNYLVISLFFAGMAIGQMLFGPISDAYGRRLTVLIGLTLFIIGTLVCFFSQSMEMLLFGRIIQAIGVSGPRIASVAIIRDLYNGNEMARVMSFINAFFILVPMIAPIVGQTIAQLIGWRHIFTVFIIMAVITGIWFFSRQGETLIKQKRKKISLRHILGSIMWICKQPQVMGPALGLGFIFGAFLAYLSASQTIFQDFYDLGTWFPLVFAILAFSIGSASFASGMLVMKLGMITLIKVALVMVFLFGLTLTLATLIKNANPPFFWFYALMFCGFFFIGILFGNLNALAMIPVGHIAGIGAAFIGSFTSLIAVPIATFINHFLKDTILPISLGFLVFGSLAYICVNWGIKNHQTID